MRRPSWLIQAALFYFLTLIAALLPSPIAQRFGSFAGSLIPLVVPKRRKIAIENIRAALPYMKASPLWTSTTDAPEVLADKTFKNLGRSLMEVCRLYHGRGHDLMAKIEIRGLENYEAAHNAGKGVLFLTGHCGNWELVALAFSHLVNTQMTVVARKQNNPYLNEMVETMRMRYKNSVLYKQGALKGMLKVLKAGGNVGLLADQAVFPEEGVLIDVLGRKAWASKAPVIVAQKSGAAILPSFIHREGDHHVITLFPAFPLSSDTSDEGIKKDIQALSRYVEEFVIAHPTQWYWVHRRWKRAGESVP